MKTYTHAWIAFKAIERLERALPAGDENQPYAQALIAWFKRRKDGVISGAWYPDSIIKDNATSHVLKFTPCDGAVPVGKSLPDGMELAKAAGNSCVYGRSFTVEPSDNLPQRCEALAHAVIDNLKVQQTENKGSPVAPTDNHIALLLFMLSHYVADAHMPLHCDSRPFSDGKDLHGEIEGVWEKEVDRCYEIDKSNSRFYYNRESYPLLKNSDRYSFSFLKAVEDNLAARPFIVEWGRGNNNVMDYMSAVCVYSYLMAYNFVPPQYGNNVTLADLKAQNPALSVEAMSSAVLSDAIESVARVWLRVWRRYSQWKKN